MGASLILTAFFTGLSVAATSAIDVAEVDVFDDGFNLTSTSLDKRQGQAERLTFNLAGATSMMTGYTIKSNGEGIRNVINVCQEYQGSNVVTFGDCVADAVVPGLTYAALGATGYLSAHAAVNLLPGSQGLANSIVGDQGQGASATRAVMAELPRFSYGSGGLSDTMIDTMDHALDMARSWWKWQMTMDMVKVWDCKTSLKKLRASSRSRIATKNMRRRTASSRRRIPSSWTRTPN